MSFATLLSLAIAGAAFALASAIPSGADPDTYWHLASARWMVEHGALLTRDPFSSTVSGVSYSVGEWLGQLVWYLAYRLDGWQGLVIVRALAVGAAGFFVTRVVLVAQPRPMLAIAPLLAALAISKTTWTDRPQLFTLVLFSVFLFVLLRAHLGMGSRLLAALPPLLLLWTNLHAGYAIGIGLIVLFLLGAFVERRPHARPLLAVLVVGAGLSQLNPSSLGALGSVAHAASPPRFIAEELPPDLFSPQGFVFGLLLVSALGSAIIAGSRDRMWPILLVPLAWLGLSGQRHLPLAAIPLAAFVAEALPRALLRAWPALRLRETPVPRVAGPRALVVVTLMAVALLGAARVAPSSPDDSAYPAGALAALAGAPREVLNEYDWGGYLIWNAPEHPVFIDGRLFLYFPDVLAEFIESTRLRPDFRDVLDRRRIETVLLRPSAPLAVFLRESGWRVRAEESGRYVLLVRP